MLTEDDLESALLDDTLSPLPPPGPTVRLPAFSESEEPGEFFPSDLYMKPTLLANGKKNRKTRGDHLNQQPTCKRRPRFPRYLYATSAASVGFRHTTPAPPAGGVTAASSVCAHRVTR
ncbi:hypothetical protein ACER0C_002617 [Sarotherodon galilaeus]